MPTYKYEALDTSGAEVKDSIEARCSLDGEKFVTVRQGYFPAQQKVMVGVMCCAPEGQGFDATFDQLLLEAV